MLVAPIMLIRANNKRFNNKNINSKGDNQTKPFAAFQNTIVTNFNNPKQYHPNMSFGKNPVLNLFKRFAVNETNPLWDKFIAREKPFIKALNDYRTIFRIDFDRIIHSGSYSRMKGKTQVFSRPKNDMISTRITHVDQVASIAEGIAEALGLNLKLTRAIAIGHDVGHAPFGHSGESKLNKIAKAENLNFTFWHEKNSLRFLDDIETKNSINGNIENLNLTYAVRDGIISHCGEVDENGLKPRREYLDLRKVEKTDKIMPFTWEGCVMRIADKIAYIGKDIEDALDVGLLSKTKLNDLRKTVNKNFGFDFDELNNSILIKHFIADLLENSSPEKGLTFSEPTFNLMNKIKAFNYQEIYIPKSSVQDSYTDLVIETIYKKLLSLYKGENTLTNIDKMPKGQTELSDSFKKWLIKYSDIATEKRNEKYKNNLVYSIMDKKDYKRSIIEYISGLTDESAINSFESIIFPY